MPHECVLCDESITNPICPECQARQMEQWFNERKLHYIGNLKDMAQITKSYPEEYTTCIFCGNYMNICSHCFSHGIMEMIEEKLHDDFLLNFSFH